MPESSLRDAAVALGHYITSRILEPRIRVTRLDVPITGLPSGLEGFCIAQMSDLHVGTGAWEPVHQAEAAAAVLAAHPDVIVNTGDYVWKEADIDDVAAAVSLFIPAGPGSAPPNLAILGNHDYRRTAEYREIMVCRLERLGVRLLTNEAVCVGYRKHGISFIGLTEETPGIEEGIASLLSAGRPRVALVHNPDLAQALPPGSADLILAGHTHAGQIALPGLEAWIVRNLCGSHYVHGMYQVNGMPLYVNQGIGCTGLPFRFRSAPEVALFRLTPCLS